MALTANEQAYFTAHKTLVLSYVNAIYSGLSTVQQRDLTSCAIALGLMNRTSSDNLGSTFAKSQTVPTGLVDKIYDFVGGTSEGYVFPQGETDLMPRNSRLAYRKALSLLNLYDYANQQWETNLNVFEIKASLTSLFNRFGHLATNGWQKIFNNEFTLGVQDEASLSVTNPILPATGRWGIVNATTLDYQELNSYESTDESSITGGDSTIARSTEQAYSGSYSMKTTVGAAANTTLIAQPTATLATTTQYTVTAWAYIPSGWSGGNLSWNHDFFSDITIDSSTSFNASITDQWQSAQMVVTTGTDVVGQWLIQASGTPVAAETVYFDFFRVTDGTNVWDATAQSNNTRWESISYLGHAYRDFQYFSDATLASQGLNEFGHTEVGIGVRNLQGYDIVNVLPDMQFVDSNVYVSTEFIVSDNKSFREITAVKAKEGKDYITW
tara:strand:+ start:404 stop:1723 length:1320 start_codon:yes stop_codon:yes gene_type:complete